MSDSNTNQHVESVGDLINRQAAIDGVKILHEVAWKNWHEPTLSANVVIDMLKNLPSAQPEIIRCKDCKYSSPNKVYGCRIYSFADDLDERMYSDDFCSYAERRTDDER